MSVSHGCASNISAARPQRFRFQEVHMGAKVEMTFYADSQQSADTAARAAFDEIAAWDRALSDYGGDSEVSTLPKITGQSTAVQDRLAKAISKSMEFNHSSSGAFDCALGQLTQLWRTAFRESKMPSDVAIAKAMVHSGCAHVIWIEATHSVTFDKPDIQFDFGAIGQGLAADAAMDVLRAHSISSALIDISGDILASDPPPQSNGWLVQIEPEFQGEHVRSVLLRNQALCVSGDTGQPGKIDGKTFSHILNPKNGRPIDLPRQSVVIASDATTADAISTIACVMSVQELKDFAIQFPEVQISIERLPEDGGIQTIEPLTTSPTRKIQAAHSQDVTPSPAAIPNTR